MKLFITAVVIAAGLALSFTLGDLNAELTARNVLAGISGGLVTSLGLVWGCADLTADLTAVVTLRVLNPARTQSSARRNTIRPARQAMFPAARQAECDPQAPRPQSPESRYPSPSYSIRSTGKV